MMDPQELRDILRQHVSRYPRMQAQDLAKLVYQAEFSSGHLISDEETDASLRRLQDEIQVATTAASAAEAASISVSVPRFEPVENRLFRIHLAGLLETGIDPATVHRFFMMAVKEPHGTAGGFREGLSVLRQFLQDRTQDNNADLTDPAVSLDLATSPDAIDALTDSYDFRTCPPFRHSPAYRQAYAPAYRIVPAAFRDYFPAFCRIDTLLRPPPSDVAATASHTPAPAPAPAPAPITIAIDGNCGAGKSTLAELLRKVYAAPQIHMDHFFLPPALRTPERLREPGGNVDYDRFACEVIPELASGRGFTYHAFDCHTLSMEKTIRVPAHALRIVEGSYSHHPRFGSIYDLKIFLRIDRDEQLRRIRERNGPDILRRFVETWIPMEDRYFEAFDIIRGSDLVISLPVASAGK